MTTLNVAAVGAPTRRLEGVAKVTGRARYAAEYPLDNLAHGWIVCSTIAHGIVRSVEADAARSTPGVLEVVTHENALRLGETDDAELAILQSPQVSYRGQVVALVVATTPEVAREAAERLIVEYDEAEADTSFAIDHPEMHKPSRINPFYPPDTSVGDVEAALAAAEVVVDVTYSTPTEHNNPMEPHAATAVWAADGLTVHDSTQGTWPVRTALAALFGVNDVHVLAEHVGGGFGSKGSPKAHVVLAAMAARILDRAVRVVMTRRMTYTLTGYRTPTVQRIQLGATHDGRFRALAHDVWEQSSRLVEFAEQTATCSRMMYDVETLRTTHRLLRLHVPTPRWMRAPGEAPGMYALESAVDELAVALDMDPIELRIRNEPDRDFETGLPYSSRGLVECLRAGADRSGWAGRDPRPQRRRDGEWLLGSGVAASVYPARAAPSTATVRRRDGNHVIEVNATDIGTGARTAMAQLAADELGVPVHQVEIRIGDSAFGEAMVAAGSAGTASWGLAVVKACRQLIESGQDEVTVDTADDLATLPKAARYAFGAQFATVRVNTVTGEIRVPRMVGVFAAGRIVNPTTARSQLLGGMTWGLSMALHEESVYDPAFGGWTNQDLAGYHVAAHADVEELDVSWLDERDDIVNPLGIKGVGEIGIVGAAAAIGNAVWHATGTRFRELPLTPDKILAALD